MNMAAHAEPDELLRLYRTMLTIRRFETAAARLMAANKLPGFLHLSIGQEAVAAGVCGVLRPTDYIATTHRGHGHCIAKGGDLGRMMAELFGRQDGYCKGRSGSMHVADPVVGILSANGIVGGGLPMAVGAAYAARVQGTDRVTVAFFGEGAVAEGVFHECLNLAALWELPVIFVCENNLYAEMGHVSLHLANPEVHSRAAAYGMPGACVDGNDVLAVRSAANAAVARARGGEGPSLLECQTYRWNGHFEGDAQKYRSADEVALWRARDPIPRLQGRLLAAGDLDAGGDADLISAVEAAVAAAMAFAEASPPPDQAVLLEDVVGAELAAGQGGG